MCSIYRRHRRLRRAGRTKLCPKHLLPEPPRTLPQTSRWGLSRISPSARPARRLPRRARTSQRQRAGGALRAERRGAFSTADSGSGAWEVSARPRGGRGARLPPGPRSVRGGRGSSAPPAAAPGAPGAGGVSRRRAEGRGDRSSHTRAHAHTLRLRLSPLWRSGGSSAPAPQWSGRHVGNGHVKGAAVLRCRRRSATQRPNTETRGQETTAVCGSGSRPRKWDRTARGLGRKTNAG